jgi:hypothetical protein
MRSAGKYAPGERFSASNQSWKSTQIAAESIWTADCELNGGTFAREVRIRLDKNVDITYLGLIHLMKYVPYLYIWYAAPRQHLNNPARWYNVGVSQLELDQKTSDMFCHT